MFCSLIIHEFDNVHCITVTNIIILLTIFSFRCLKVWMNLWEKCLYIRSVIVNVVTSTCACCFFQTIFLFSHLHTRVICNRGLISRQWPAKFTCYLLTFRQLLFIIWAGTLSILPAASKPNENLDVIYQTRERVLYPMYKHQEAGWKSGHNRVF
jgi:hypothetical protein